MPREKLYVLCGIHENTNNLGKLHGDKFYAEFDKQFGLKPVEVGQAVASNATSIMGGQSFLTPTPHARPNMTGTGAIFDDTTIIPSVPVDTFHTGLAGELYKSRHHNMPATIQWQIQAFPHKVRVFSPVSPPINLWDDAESPSVINGKEAESAYQPKVGSIPAHPPSVSLSTEQQRKRLSLKSDDEATIYKKLGTHDIFQSSSASDSDVNVTSVKQVKSSITGTRGISQSSPKGIDMRLAWSTLCAFQPS